MDNQGSVVLRGRIGSDLSSMSAQNGTKGLRFRMAAPQWRITDAGQYEEREPKWYTVCVWDRLEQNIARSVQKGTPVIVCGRPSARGWLGPDQQVRSE
ncbi:MAG: single-stranded DNA-binding protein, partial [Trueperella pyogenes]|nr:single-stranded DNA-binding protein [Trueperella pyogenes]